ncbi:DNA methyltransferase [Neisseria gonorrhoeae]
MKNRLEIAKELLKDDGLIFVQCDDKEQAYLKVLLDETFTRENFINCIAVKMSEPSGNKMAHTSHRLPKIKEYILIYKNKNIKLNPRRKNHFGQKHPVGFGGKNRPIHYRFVIE